MQYDILFRPRDILYNMKSHIWLLVFILYVVKELSEVRYSYLLE